MLLLIRFIFVGLIAVLLLRRAFKVMSSVPRTPARPQQGRKNDFRDIPPPPENPELG